MLTGDRKIFTEVIKQNKSWCVYGLVCPIDLRVKYVGITCNFVKRYNQHFTSMKPIHKYNWIVYLSERGLVPIPVILKECDEHIEAAQYEKTLIDRALPQLLNVSQL